MKKFIIAAAFAVVAASPALAATQQYRNAAPVDSSYANGAYASYNDPDAVVVDGKVVGRDPDAFIREQLLRAGDPTEQNGGQ